MGWELLLLALPAAFLSGYAVRRRSRAADDGNCAGLSADYVQGIHYLLDEQPDKAIDVFVNMLDVNSDTVETHLAVGNLFRRRGEVERAIRIHQNVIARPGLNSDQRNQAVLELGQDYLKSGILGRAESLLLELLDQPRVNVRALPRLLDIYQQEREWEKAIDIVQRLEHAGGAKLSAEAAHFCCELAEAALVAGDKAAAQKYIQRALGFDRQCARANILTGRIQCQAGNHRAALNAYRLVEQQEPHFISEIIEPVVQCSRAAGCLDEAEHYLEHLVATYGCVTAVQALAELTRQSAGEREAAAKILPALRKAPSVRGVDHLLGLATAYSDPNARAALQPIKELTVALLAASPPYQCAQCGLKLKTLLWQCPGCQGWGKIRFEGAVAARAV